MKILDAIRKKKGVFFAGVALDAVFFVVIWALLVSLLLSLVPELDMVKVVMEANQPATDAQAEAMFSGIVNDTRFQDAYGAIVLLLWGFAGKVVVAWLVVQGVAWFFSAGVVARPRFWQYMLKFAVVSLGFFAVVSVGIWLIVTSIWKSLAVVAQPNPAVLSWVIVAFLLVTAWVAIVLLVGVQYPNVWKRVKRVAKDPGRSFIAYVVPVGVLSLLIHLLREVVVAEQVALSLLVFVVLAGCYSLSRVVWQTYAA